MDEKLLSTFVAVAECQSFHRAAEKLNVTQAAVSARVRALEEHLEVALFQRGPGGTRLSEAGLHLRPYAEQMLSQWQQIRTGMGQQFSNRIALRLGCQLSIWDAHLVDLTIWVEETLGKLPLTLNFDHESNVIEQVRTGSLDLALTHERAVGNDLAVVPLPPVQMVLVTSQPHRMSDADLPLFLNLQLGPDYDAAVREQLSGRSGHLFLGNAAMALRYLTRRGGMAFFPRQMVRDALNKGELCEVSGAKPFAVPLMAVYDPQGPAAGTVAQILPGLQDILK